MKFELKQKIEIACSGEVGMIKARMEHVNTKPQYCVHYCAGDGRAVDQWFYESELKAVRVVKAAAKKTPVKKAPVKKAEPAEAATDTPVEKKAPPMKAAKKKPVKKAPIKKVRSKKAAKKAPVA